LEKCLPANELEREVAVRPLMRSVMEAVSQIHSQGVAHGDLSLENVLLTADHMDPEAALRVIDFGAATGGIAAGLRGKPSYQAPEVHLDSVYDAFVADAFSVGVMLFTLTVGNYPWKSSRPHICPMFKFCSERGLVPYLAKRKLRIGQRTVSLMDVLSQELVSLLEGLLSFDSSQRLSVTHALQHPWFLCYKEEPAYH
jgi:serine/threonine-protein kinase Chk1